MKIKVLGHLKDIFEGRCDPSPREKPPSDLSRWLDETKVPSFSDPKQLQSAREYITQARESLKEDKAGEMINTRIADGLEKSASREMDVLRAQQLPLKKEGIQKQIAKEREELEPKLQKLAAGVDIPRYISDVSITLPNGAQWSRQEGEKGPVKQEELYSFISNLAVACGEGSIIPDWKDMTTEQREMFDPNQPDKVLTLLVQDLFKDNPKDSKTLAALAALSQRFDAGAITNISARALRAFNAAVAPQEAMHLPTTTEGERRTEVTVKDGEITVKQFRHLRLPEERFDLFFDPFNPSFKAIREKKDQLLFDIEYCVTVVSNGLDEEPTPTFTVTNVRPLATNATLDPTLVQSLRSGN
jgi:hypothetical protein